MNCLLIRVLVWCAVLAGANRCAAQDVLGSAGGNFQNATHHIAFTIGEPVIETHVQAATVITQGFHQPPDDFSTAVATVTDPQVEVLAFPNPARDEVTVQVLGIDGTFSIDLFDAAGRAVRGHSSFSNNAVLDVSSLASGTYHARLTNDGRYLTTVHLSIAH